MKRERLTEAQQWFRGVCLERCWGGAAFPFLRFSLCSVSVVPGGHLPLGCLRAWPPGRLNMQNSCCQRAAGCRLRSPGAGSGVARAAGWRQTPGFESAPRPGTLRVGAQLPRARSCVGLREVGGGAPAWCGAQALWGPPQGRRPPPSSPRGRLPQPTMGEMAPPPAHHRGDTPSPPWGRWPRAGCAFGGCLGLISGVCCLFLLRESSSNSQVTLF